MFFEVLKTVYPALQTCSQILFRTNPDEYRGIGVIIIGMTIVQHYMGDANEAAHVLARYGASHGLGDVWLVGSPYFTFHVLVDDCVIIP
jgi:hypothetical protein